VSDLYTDFAADYEWLFADDVVGSSPVPGATSAAGRDLLDAALATLAPGAPVLDCACGIGTDALALAQRGFKVTATDGSSSMVARASERLAASASQVTVLQSLWQDLPVKLTGRFDLAICLGNAIVHAGSAPAMVESLESIRDVLAPDGKLIVDSRNWELMYSSWPRIVTAPRVRERRGLRCSCLYIWTIPEGFDRPCQAEIIFLFENQENELSHRRYEMIFQPFTHLDLRRAVENAGFQITGDSFEPASHSYAIGAVASAGNRRASRR
jgi:glycine/sarcosine N-methyltransferase